jgi:hypothetical protein
MDLEEVRSEIVGWIDKAQDSDQWAICGLHLFGSG